MISGRDDNPCRPRHFKPPPCGPMPASGPVRQSLETIYTRLLLMTVLFGLVFVGISGRLIDLMWLKDGDPKLARAHVRPHIEISRADILDRNGVALATTLEGPSVYADPKQMAAAGVDPTEAARKLATVLPGVDVPDLAKRLGSDHGFAWIRRQLTPDEEARVNGLGIPGIFFQNEQRRIYPQGPLAAHVIGYVGIDNKGFAGIERGLDDELKTSDDPLELSIDVRLQYILQEEIQQQITAFNAKGGMGIIADVNTGEILALTSLPEFDPNAVRNADPKSLFNRATLGTYEMGSVFKIFNTAMALDDHVTTLQSSFDATQPIHVGRFTIHDDHAKARWLTVSEIFMYSSNIGSAKMAVQAGIDRQQDFLGRLGLLKEPKIEIPEVGRPEIPHPWHLINTMTVAFGHGISVSPLQMVVATSAVVNGGVLHRATFLKRASGSHPDGARVLSESTSEDMRRLLRLVVERGTGKFAAAPGYLVGGKTGTAEKVEGHHYAEKELLSSFIGVFPINQPRYIILVSIDTPHGTAKSGGEATGGWVAAPAVSRIVQRMAPIEGIPPVDEDSPEIRRALLVNSGPNSAPASVPKLAAN
ncbi:MAG TPA: penicillin-binding protein 2 [Stellaceae bacterium]|nr:penicillin-binding protein 2 [Stellaceae bacterium]